MSADTELFPGFATRRIATSGAEIHCVVGGSGPPLLLLHGYPQTHAMWHRIASRLAERHTVVCADLRGYGDSSKPASDSTHAAYSKRAMAQDMVELMRALGHATFRLVGHDRGGRVAHRLCVDHPDAVERVAVLDISPTRAMYRGTTQAFATAYYHWFFLIQPFDLPERLIGADPRYYLRRKLGGWGSSASVFDPRAFADALQDDTLVQLVLDEQLQEVQVGQLGALGLLDSHGEGLGHAGEPEVTESQGQLWVHRNSSRR